MHTLTLERPAAATTTPTAAAPVLAAGAAFGGTPKGTEEAPTPTRKHVASEH